MDTTKLKLDLDIEAGRASRVRDGTKKLSIRGDYDGEYDIEFWDKCGTENCVELKWCGHIDRVDMRVKNKPYWVWCYANLNKKDIRQLIKWLARIERQLE